MTVRVLFFAILRERLGTASLERTISKPITVGKLWETLCIEHPSLCERPGPVVFAVNQVYVDSEQTLQDNDEVAFIPPVSGGY